MNTTLPRTAPVVIMPRPRAVTLAEKLKELVGLPQYKDVFDNGDCRMKYSYAFPIDLAIKVKELLDTYPDYYVKKYNPGHTQSKGSVKGPVSVIWLIVQPEIIAYPCIESKHKATA